MKNIKLLTTLWNLTCFVAAFGSEVMADPQMMGLFPPKYAHVITMVALVAMWLRGHWNILVNADGTPSTVAYVPPAVQPVSKTP